jgi:hypothetical protein
LGSDHTLVFGLRITRVIVSGNQTIVLGSGITIGRTGVRPVSFRIDVFASETSSGGTFEIQLSNGYDSGVIPVSVARM